MYLNKEFVGLLYKDGKEYKVDSSCIYREEFKTEREAKNVARSIKWDAKWISYDFEIEEN